MNWRKGGKWKKSCVKKDKRVQRKTECAVGKIQFSVFSFQFSVFSFQSAECSFQSAVFRVQSAECRVQNLEISSYSCDSFYSWFTIFAFFDKDVIHESNGGFHGLA